VTPEEEDRELWRDQAMVNIEKMRRDIKWENRKFMVSLLVALAVAAGAGAAVATYFGKPAVTTNYYTIQALPAPAK